MSSRFGDRNGIAGAFLVGVVVGLALSAPMLPRGVPVALSTVSVGPIGGYLLVGVLAVLVIPLCIVLLHILFMQADR